jgi:hypothetical protein
MVFTSSSIVLWDFKGLRLFWYGIYYNCPALGQDAKITLILAHGLYLDRASKIS